MTRLELAPDLVEEAVFHGARRASERGDPRAVRWFEQRERLYALTRTAEREAAFRAHALEHFRALRLQEPLQLALEACPAVLRHLDVLFVRRARRVKEESAELYRGSGAATRAVLALRPERFLDVEPLFAFVRRELLYVDDMLDERFGYAPDLVDRLPLDPGRRDVVRERVGRAWRERIEARARGEERPGRFEELVEAATHALATA